MWASVPGRAGGRHPVQRGDRPGRRRSVGHFHLQVERTRNLLLGMLGHDMRSPLNTTLTTASCLAAMNAGEQVSASAARLIRSGAAMQALLDDLVDFNRTKLGLGVKVVPSDIDVAAVVTDELAQLRGAYPNRHIALAATGDSRGRGTARACSSWSATSSRMRSDTGRPTRWCTWRFAARRPTSASKSPTAGRR